MSPELFSDFRSSYQLFSARRSSCQLILCFLISSLLFSHLLSSSHVSSALVSSSHLITALLSALSNHIGSWRQSKRPPRFPQRRFDTEKKLFTQRQGSFYTQKLLHRQAFTQRSFMQRSPYTAFTHSKPSHREAPTQKSFYTEQDLHTASRSEHDPNIAETVSQPPCGRPSPSIFRARIVLRNPTCRASAHVKKRILFVTSLKD